MICIVDEVKMPSIGLVPLAQVFNGLSSEWRRVIDSLSPNDVSLLAALLLVTSSFKSIINMIWSPDSIQACIAVIRSSRI